MLLCLLLPKFDSRVAAGEARANAAEPRGAARLQCMASSSSWHPCLDIRLLLQVTALFFLQRSTASAGGHCWGSDSIGTGHANWAHEAHPWCPSVLLRDGISSSFSQPIHLSRLSRPDYFSFSRPKASLPPQLASLLVFDLLP